VTESELRQRIDDIVPPCADTVVNPDLLKCRIFKLVKEQGALQPDPQPKPKTPGQQLAAERVTRTNTTGAEVFIDGGLHAVYLTFPLGGNAADFYDQVRLTLAEIIDAGIKSNTDAALATARDHESLRGQLKMAHESLIAVMRKHDGTRDFSVTLPKLIDQLNDMLACYHQAWDRLHKANEKLEHDLAVLRSGREDGALRMLDMIEHIMTTINVGLGTTR
jgi:hypothetical protein